jgi:hypothetical protein
MLQDRLLLLHVAAGLLVVACGCCCHVVRL